MKSPKFLVRPHDFHIWDLDESNNCYRSYSTRSVTYSDGTRPQAQPSYTFERLTEIYDFFSIEEDEVEFYEEKCKFQMDFTIWQCRSDGHGGSKGGTMGEYLEYLERVKRYNFNKDKK